MTTILYLHSSSDLYGSDRSLLRTVQGLDREHFRAIVCLPYQGPLVEALQASGIPVYVQPLAIMRRAIFTPRGIICFVVTLLQSVLKLRRLIRQERVGLLHSNTTAVVSGGVMAKVTGIPHIWHVREIIVSPVIVRQFIAWLLRHMATRVIGVSTSVIENLVKDQPSIRDKSIVIHNGIDTASFGGADGKEMRAQYSLRDDQVFVGMLGRVGSWKGQDLFLEVAQRVWETVGDSARFLAVGSALMGEEDKMTAFRENVKRRGMKDCFFIEEFRADIRDVLASLDVFVLPSRLPDPFPTTVLEAMAAGKAIVANGHGGVTEMIVDGESGFLVPPNDVDVMVERICKFVTQKSLRKQCGEAARNRAEKYFDRSTYTKLINQIYCSMSLAGRQ